MLFRFKKYIYTNIKEGNYYSLLEFLALGNHIYIYIYIYSFRRLVKGPSNNALLSLDLEDHLCDLGVLNKFVDFFHVIQ